MELDPDIELTPDVLAEYEVVSGFDLHRVLVVAYFQADKALVERLMDKVLEQRDYVVELYGRYDIRGLQDIDEILSDMQLPR